MLAIERQQMILDTIYRNKSVKVADLSRYFNVTEETIRRDLNKFAKQKIITKTYGGAILSEQIEEKELDDPAFSYRLKENRESKNKIGRAIATLIKPGEIIALDSSTTCLEVAKYIPEFNRTTVITNSISAIVELSKREDVTVISTGGTLRNHALSLIGPTAKKNIMNYYVDKAIISCKGMSKARGAMESNELEKEIKQSFIEVAREVIVAVDHAKIDKGSIYHLINLEKIDYVVTDQPMDTKWQQFYEENNVKMIIA